MLTMPVIVLFYYNNGLGTRHVFILQAIYSLSIVILEIPSGYIADVFGRRTTLIIGSFFGFFGFLAYSVMHGFWGFAVAEIFLGIGQSMISGADSALLYDTLVIEGKRDKYLKLEGRMTSVGNFSEALAGIAGGLLATLSLRTPFYFQSFIAFWAIPATILLIEPKIHSHAQLNKLDYFIRILRFSLFENKLLRRNIFFSSVIGCATLTMAWFVQPYFKSINIPVSMYGILWTVLNFSVGVTSLYAFKFDKKLGQMKTIWFIVLVIPLGYWLSGIFMNMWGLVFILIFYFARGIASPVLKEYINDITPSEMRATVLSIRNFVIRLLFAIAGPFLGWLTDFYSLSQALLIAGTIFFLLASITVFYYIRSIKKTS
jgi:MFS family permease